MILTVHHWTVRFNYSTTVGSNIFTNNKNEKGIGYTYQKEIYMKVMITHGKKVNSNKIKHKRRGIFIRAGIGFPKTKKRKILFNKRACFVEKITRESDWIVKWRSALDLKKLAQISKGRAHRDVGIPGKMNPSIHI